MADKQEEEDRVRLPETISALIPACRERLSKIKRECGSIQLDSHTIQDLIAGSRGIKSLLWDISKLDPDHGILYRGFSIPQCFASLPHSSPGGQPLPEGVLWLFLTSYTPSPSQATSLSLDLAARIQKVPDFVFSCINALPISAHPMTQLVSAIMALQTESQFASAYASGMPINQLWRPALEDSLNLIAQLPLLAAFIYRRIHKEGHVIHPDPRLDFAANFCHMLGFDDPDMYEMMRMYMVIHSDHEGGAVSAHAVRLVGSALADPYLAFTAGMNGCAGPLHGLAIQESFKWISKVLSELGRNATTTELEDYVRRKLQAGTIIPGFGHALLKKTDPRYTCLYEFCERKFPDDPYFELLAKLGEIVPAVMKQQGKVRNPWPNVDAIIGVVFNHFGLHKIDFFPVVLGVARSIGSLSQLVWDRALCLPIERPSSVNLDWIENFCQRKSDSAEKQM
ncbi:hypothetical protein GOP47_0002345 [Adiantum capillus-veneris]|uniref:Citrate synthase n=1 Tax=Adiantum capillus-veneris TaxID=13818 RepID=A0A9D4VBX2_ADICA|nr:hypothetical protein GOP47_0002345 [Adiantum capillus-veneris]